MLLWDAGDLRPWPVVDCCCFRTKWKHRRSYVTGFSEPRDERNTRCGDAVFPIGISSTRGDVPDSWDPNGPSP